MASRSTKPRIQVPITCRIHDESELSDVESMVYQLPGERVSGDLQRQGTVEFDSEASECANANKILANADSQSKPDDGFSCNSKSHLCERCSFTRHKFKYVAIKPTSYDVCATVAEALAVTRHHQG